MSDPLLEYSNEISRRYVLVDAEQRKRDPYGVLLAIHDEIEDEWCRTRPVTMLRIRLYLAWRWILRRLGR